MCTECDENGLLSEELFHSNLTFKICVDVRKYLCVVMRNSGTYLIALGINSIILCNFAHTFHILRNIDFKMLH